jgi:hypothetical protein
MKYYKLRLNMNTSLSAESRGGDSAGGAEGSTISTTQKIIIK